MVARQLTRNRPFAKSDVCIIRVCCVNVFIKSTFRVQNIDARTSNSITSIIYTSSMFIIILVYMMMMKYLHFISALASVPCVIITENEERFEILRNYTYCSIHSRN